MTEAFGDHLVAATHLVLGPCNFIILRLPSNWDLQIGRHPTDVDYTVAADGVRWAQEGRAAGLLVDRKANRAMELNLRTARGSIPTLKLSDRRRAAYAIAGHTASCEMGTSNLGLFGTKRYSILHIAYRCEPTQRLVDLRFMHRGDFASLEALMGPLAGSRCH